MRNRILEILNGLIFATAIVGANLKSLYSIPYWLEILISVVLVVIYVAIAFKKKKEKSFSIKEGSRKFFNYFRKWYNQDGFLSVYCSDLDWLDTENGQAVLFALRKKAEAKHLNLYLRNRSNKIVNDLRTFGANVFQIKDHQITKHRVSIIEHDGIKKIIIRNKETENDKITFVEASSLNDPYLFSLVEDLLNNCKN